MHCRASTAVEHTELDARSVCPQGHLATQGIYLPHHLPLGQSPDGRVAGHLGHGVQVDGQERGAGPHAGSSQGRLHPRVPGPHDNDVEMGFHMLSFYQA